MPYLILFVMAGQQQPSETRKIAAPATKAMATSNFTPVHHSEAAQ